MHLCTCNYSCRLTSVNQRSALSKNIDVAFWLQYRKSIGEPPLVEALDFVIMNEQLHDDFDSFKKTEIRPNSAMFLL